MNQRSLSEIRGQIIKAYRETHSKEQLLTQSALAERMGVTDRRIRSWESGDLLSMRSKNVWKLHEEIGIPLRLLGDEGAISPQEMLELHARVKLLLDHGAYIGAFATSGLLINECYGAKKRGWKSADFILPSAYLTLGMATATLEDDPRQALKQFRSMESTLAKSGDTNATALAQTFQAEMYRRMKDPAKAQELHQNILKYMFPEQKYVGVGAHVAGNCMQMLARTLLDMGEEEKALDYLRRAEELAQVVVPQDEGNYYLCFGELSIKAEIVKTFMLSKQYDKGFDELKEMKRLAEQASPRWKIQTYIKEGEFCMRLGRSDENPSMKQRGEAFLLRGYKEALRIEHTRQQNVVHRLLNKWESNSSFDLEILQNFREKLNKLDEEKR